MTVETERNGSEIIFKVKGELDAITAPELKAVVESAVDDEIREVRFDFSDVRYISSAGLRVLLMTQYMMDERNGRLEVTGVGDFVMEILEDSGFITFLNVTRA